MFEEYLQDASFFIREARTATDEHDARRYYRVSIFCTASAAEAFVNFISDILEKGKTLPPHEIAFLRDKKYAFEANKVSLLVEKREFHSLEDKLGLLLKKFVEGFNFESDGNWKALLDFKEERNQLVHPKQDEDDRHVAEYDAIACNGLGASIALMDLVLQGSRKRPIPQRIRDLIPDPKTSGSP